jgi:hypothetical protein
MDAGVDLISWRDSATQTRCGDPFFSGRPAGTYILSSAIIFGKSQGRNGIKLERGCFPKRGEQFHPSPEDVRIFLVVSAFEVGQSRAGRALLGR